MSIKKYIATGAAVVALLFSASAALAESSATATVTDDGDAVSIVKDSDTFTVDNHNVKADLFNVDFGAGVSGLNEQKGTEDGASMTTGSAFGSGNTENYENSNVTDLGEGVEIASLPGSSATVGDDGDAMALAFDTDVFKVTNFNLAGVFNVTAGVAISGLNAQICGEDDNAMTTGSSTAMATTLNEVNSNWTKIGDGEGGTVSALAAVADDGDAFAKVENKDNVTVINTNHGYLANATLAAAVSGGNTQFMGEDNNSMNTGSATAVSNASNYINSNITEINSVSSEGTNASASTKDGGEDSCLTNSCGGGGTEGAKSIAEDTDTVKVTNTNTAKVTNISAGVAVSGGNTQANNEQGTTMTTGSSNGTSTSVNTVNSNWTGVGSNFACGQPTCLQ